MELIDELLEWEHAGWVALCNGTADEFYGAAMTDDALMVVADGSVMGRREVVAALAGSPPWSAYTITDPQIAEPAEDVVALVYTATAQRHHHDPFVATMTSVYVLVDDEWRLAFHQQTPRR